MSTFSDANSGNQKITWKRMMHLNSWIQMPLSRKIGTKCAHTSFKRPHNHFLEMTLKIFEKSCKIKFSILVFFYFFLLTIIVCYCKLLWIQVFLHSANLQIQLPFAYLMGLFNFTLYEKYNFLYDFQEKFFYSWNGMTLQCEKFRFFFLYLRFYVKSFSVNLILEKAVQNGNF